MASRSCVGPPRVYRNTTHTGVEGNGVPRTDDCPDPKHVSCHDDPPSTSVVDDPARAEGFRPLGPL